MTVWTGENREKLERLWSAGYSARLIAAEFPGSTRNAILGAVHRLKLPKRQVAVSAERTVYARKKYKPRLKLPKRQVAVSAERTVYARKKYKPRDYRPRFVSKPVCEPIDVPIPDAAARVSLLDRKEHQCCYPIEGMIYCGADKQPGSSYCPWHHRRVWVNPVKLNKRQQNFLVRRFGATA